LWYWTTPWGKSETWSTSRNFHIFKGSKVIYLGILFLRSSYTSLAKKQPLRYQLDGWEFILRSSKPTLIPHFPAKYYLHMANVLSASSKREPVLSAAKEAGTHRFTGRDIVVLNDAASTRHV
jgi:hypothetical protein